MAELKYEIVEHIGVLSENARGWRKELNLVSWNGGAPKYDIRDWAPDHSRMSRGVTLHEKEMRLIVDSVRNRGRKYTYEVRHEREEFDAQADSVNAEKDEKSDESGLEDAGSAAAGAACSETEETADDAREGDAPEASREDVQEDEMRDAI